MMEVLFRGHDMLRAGEDHPAWLEPAHDQPVEDEQVNEVEEEKHSEGIGEEVPERRPRVAARQSNADAQSAPISRPSRREIRLSLSDFGGTTVRISLGKCRKNIRGLKRSTTSK